MLRGAIISESLRPGSMIEGLGLVVTRLARFTVTDVPPWQPAVWTEIVFECADDQADALAAQLSAALTTPGWYADFSSDTETVVVFADTVFRYGRGDAAGRAEAQAYGRAHGVPETQLDWQT